MPEAKPTSIRSSSQKGMHAHYLRWAAAAAIHHLFDL